MPDQFPGQQPATAEEPFDPFPKHIAKILSDPTLIRNELDVIMLCAWNNVPLDKIPKDNIYWTHYANPYMRDAWHRVRDAVRQYDQNHKDQ